MPLRVRLRTTSPAQAHYFLTEVEARLAPVGPDDDDRVGEMDQAVDRGIATRPLGQTQSGDAGDDHDADVVLCAA
jgi:hypothetical protein